MSTLRIALIGDYDPSITAHQAIPRTLALAEQDFSLSIRADWLASDADLKLESYQAIWCVPGSPYRSKDGVLQAIRHAREQQVPFLGSCGGYQHALIEFARNVLNLPQADHAEDSPGCSLPLINALECALVEVEQEIQITADSPLAAIVKQPTLRAGYRCRYGLNPQYRPLFDGSALRFAAFDQQGDAHAFMLESHRFFVGTAFQPERDALRGELNPIIAAWLAATKP